MRPAVVFLGPTLPVDLARSIFAAEYLPPAGHGDLYRLMLRDVPPRVVAIVDGYFQFKPAVRHKEILHAMWKGAHVYGAASIGALRACELQEFGMTGIGEIFEAYRSGAIEDDDEVAIEHGPEALGYAPLSEPMVNIRATLKRACLEAVISEAARDVMLRSAKQLYFTQRSYERILTACAQSAVGKSELTAFREWLPTGRVDQKRDDAIALLQSLSQLDHAKLEPHVPNFRFEETEVWVSDMESAIMDNAADSSIEGPAHDDVLDEVRLAPGRFSQLRREALALALTIYAGRREGLHISDEQRSAALLRLREKFGLEDPAALLEWRARNCLSNRRFMELIDDLAMIGRVEVNAEPLIARRLIDVLRLKGQFESLATRAERKNSLEITADMTAVVPTFEMLLWYFGHHLNQHPPTDPERFALDQGFRNVEAFQRAVRREYLLWRNALTREAGE